jgi:hypothetical protein
VVTAGVTALDAVEATPVPTEFVAVTLKVYESPSVSPVTVHVSVPEFDVQLSPPLADAVESAAVTL